MTHALTREEKAVILDGLVSSDEEVRRLSVEQLPRLEIEEAVPQLADRLGDEVWRVRKAAVEQLVRCIDHPSVQEILIASLADGDDPGRRNSAFEALVACGRRVTSRLVVELNNPDVDVRKLVVDALAAIGDPKTTGPLVVAISDPDTNVRAAAVEALGLVGGLAEIDHLLAAVNAREEDLLVRLSALRALAALETGVAVATLGGALEESALRPAALTLLGSSDDPEAVNFLIKGLDEKSRASREATMGALLRLLGRCDDSEALFLKERIREAISANDAVIESACERLDGSNLATRLMLIQFLGLIEDARVVIPILRAGQDEAIEELSGTTLEGLGTIVPIAIDAQWDDLDIDSRGRACSVLGKVGGDLAERRLAEALEAADPEVRCRAAMALGRGAFYSKLPDLARRLETAARGEEFDSREEIAALTDAIIAMAECPEGVQAGHDIQLIEELSSRLGGAPEPVRLVIAQVLSRLGRPQDQDVIAHLLKDESPGVRRVAVRALVRFEFAESRESLRLALGDESEWVRTSAASVLGEVDDLAAAEDLERITHDEVPRVVAVAVRSYGHLHHRLAASPEEAYRLIERAMPDCAIVALASLEALMELGGPGAARLGIFATARPEPEVVRAAIACVEQHGTDEELSNLLSLIPHSEWSVRAEVARVLSQRGYLKSLPAFLRRLEVEDDPFVREAILDAIRRLEE